MIRFLRSSIINRLGYNAGMSNRLLSVINGRCPHCQRGPVFRSFLQMHERCSVCGIQFEREPGYFLMGIFFGYVLSFLLVGVTLLLLYLFARPAAWWGYVLWGTVSLLLLSPFIFKYGRLIWLHVDELLDPRPDPS